MPHPFNVRAFAVSALVLIAPVSVNAQSACPVTGLIAAQKLIRDAPLCQTAMALYESCGEKATSYQNLLDLADQAQKRCEKTFVKDISARDKRSYRQARLSCDKKIEADTLHMSHDPKMFCGPYVAYEFAYKNQKAKDERAANPNPPL